MRMRARSRRGRRHPFAPARRRVDISILADVAPFDRYSRRALRPLARHADRVTPAEGTLLASEGSRVREFMVVVRGHLVALSGGRELGRLGPGTHLGGAGLLDGGAHPCTIVAGPGVEMLVLNGPAYRWAASTLPGLAAESGGEMPVWVA